MKIECIFEIIEDSLASIKYEEEPFDAFTYSFSLWEDVEYLECFFEDNKVDLQSDFWQMRVEDAVVKMLDEARIFKEDILYYAEQGKTGGSAQLESYIFKPLHKDIYSNTRIESKAYGTVNGDAMLRMYAIRLGSNQYVVTGGAIKLTKDLQARKHTARELDKLKLASSYLKSLGIDDASDYGYLEFKNRT